MGGYLCELLSCRLPVGLGPADLAGVTLHLEVFVAFRSTKVEYLQAGGGSGHLQRKQRYEDIGSGQ